MEKLKEQWEAAPLWQKALLLFTFSLVIAYGIYISLISPLEEEISNYEKEKQQLESELNIIKSLADKNKSKLLEAKLKKMEEELKLNKTKLETLQSFIPSQLELSPLFDTVIKNCENHNLKLVGLGVEREEDVVLYYDKQINKVEIKALSKEDEKKKGKEENKDNIKEGIKAKRVYIQSFIVGNTQNIIKFLDSFSNSDRLIIIDKVDLSVDKAGINSKQDERKKLGVLGNITLATYYIPQQEEKNESKK
jgi:glycerophosphoryl diester phosphodiesterase